MHTHFTHMHAHRLRFIHMHTYTLAYMHAHSYTFTYMYIYKLTTYICIYIHTHTCTHSHTQLHLKWTHITFSSEVLAAGFLWDEAGSCWRQRSLWLPWSGPGSMSSLYSPVSAFSANSRWSYNSVKKLSICKVLSKSSMAYKKHDLTMFAK